MKQKIIVPKKDKKYQEKVAVGGQMKSKIVLEAIRTKLVQTNLLNTKMALNKKEIEKLLRTEIVYLTTSDLKGNPHVKPIWFIYYKGKIWFETHIPTRAFKNIMENNKIMLCFGGRETYLVWGKVKWYKEKDCPIPFRKLFWEKYGDDMDDSYITDKTRIFEVLIEKDVSWHYADQNWD